MPAKPGAIAAALLFLATLGNAETRVTLTLRVFPAGCDVTVDGTPAVTTIGTDGTRRLSLPEGLHTVTFSAPGYTAKRLQAPFYGNQGIEMKLEREQSRLLRADLLDTGRQPKSVSFTPDGVFIITPLLDGEGIDVIWSDIMARAATIRPPEPWAGKKGFVETCFFPSRGEMWVSQMTTGMVHVFSLADFSWVASFSTGGRWPKVIARSADETTAFVSNWLSNDVSVIDAAKRTVVARIPVGGTPRGMALSRDGAFLYVCIYDAARIVKIGIGRRVVVKRLDFGAGAMRHIVLHPATGVLYASEMHGGRIIAVDSSTDRLIGQVLVDRSINTVVLSPDGALLFASSRGPNNPTDYTKKGPSFGKIYCIDPRTLAILDWTWGGNQPTGLDVSPDGKSMAFSNFLDDTVELYRIAPPQD